MTTGKSLTQPPRTLKEAIDWVIQIKGHAQELAQQLDALLMNDGSEVALKVLDKYRLVSKSVIEKLEAANKNLENIKKFHFAYTALNNLSHGVKPFDRQSAANISADYVGMVGEWVSSVDKNNLQKLIKTFVKGLKTFVGSSGSGIAKQAYTSAYSNLDWSSLTDSDKRDCAAILLGIMPVVYIGLTYLYWQCAGTGGWDKENLNGSGSDQGSLKNFMAALGYTENLNNKNGQQIAIQLQSAFSGELKNAYGSSQTHYFKFLKALHDKAPTPPNTSHPLTALYLIGHYYITNFLYTVETSSPAAPSIAGYSGIAALAGGAYGFNLGGIGTFMSALLA